MVAIARAAVYGVALNTESAVAEHAVRFSKPPYGMAPRAPVMYIKPPNTFAADGAVVYVPLHTNEIEVCTTLAVVFERATSQVNELQALRFVSGFRVALDLCIPHAELFRPAIVQRCQDGFLPLGPFVARDEAVLSLGQLKLTTRVGSREPHTWCSAELRRPVVRLIAEISKFVTFAAGDMLLMGVPGHAPRAQAGERVLGEITGLGSVSCKLARRPR